MVEINKIHAFLVTPRAGEEESIAHREGAEVTPKDERLYDLLTGIFHDSDRECDIEIIFNKVSTGAQNNPCRELITSYAEKPNLPRARKIATRLESYTTRRSGLGLLFLMYGKHGQRHRVVVSRFPADTGILAEYKKNALSIEFLERVFMKNSHKYKAALYEHASLSGGFWKGRAVDKQIYGHGIRISEYWIEEFLASSFLTTAAAGTKRLAAALRKAVRSTNDLDVKSEITAAVTLAGKLANQNISIEDFGSQAGLSDKTTRAILREIDYPELAHDRFKFDLNEFRAQIPFRSIELDTGALLTADADDFDRIFETEILDKKKREVKITTTGSVKDEKVGKSRIR